jgi:predicted transcriptional regulator
MTVFNNSDVKNNFLFALYSATKGDFRKFKNPKEINHDIEVTNDELRDLVQSLQRDGYIKHFSDNTPEIAITEEGVEYLDQVILEKKEKIREIFLIKIYEHSRGNPNVDVNTYEVGEELGIPKTETEGIVQYLIEKGILKPFGFQEVFITSEGIDFCETRLKQSNNSSNKYIVFISRINGHREISEKLKKLLESLFGERIQVFDASEPDSISFTQDWYEKIKAGVQKCDLMISLCSPQSITHPWMIFEAGGAILNDKKIGFVCFGGQKPGDLHDPLKFSRSQAVDVTDPEHFKKNFDVLISDIAKNIGVESPTLDVLETDFFHSLVNARDGKPRKPPIVVVQKF